jgi:hypothetical protein
LHVPLIHTDDERWTTNGETSDDDDATGWNA